MADRREASNREFNDGNSHHESKADRMMLGATLTVAIAQRRMKRSVCFGFISTSQNPHRMEVNSFF
jgi:hypothetical protein